MHGLIAGDYPMQTNSLLSGFAVLNLLLLVLILPTAFHLLSTQGGFTIAASNLRILRGSLCLFFIGSILLASAPTAGLLALCQSANNTFYYIES